jgi:hypothetical protein
MSDSDECIVSAEMAWLIRTFVDAEGVRLSERDQGFRCVACRRRVVPVKTGAEQAHFEHVRPNPNCTLGVESRNGTTG